MDRNSPALVLDVRSLPGPDQHTRVQRVFDRLEPGESLEVLCNHHPAPLLYGLMSRNREKMDRAESSMRQLSSGPYVVKCTRSNHPPSQNRDRNRNEHSVRQDLQ